jgi:hypothetical protein
MDTGGTPIGKMRAGDTAEITATFHMYTRRSDAAIAGRFGVDVGFLIPREKSPMNGRFSAIYFWIRSAQSRHCSAHALVFGTIAGKL